jgi:membrane fusion protein
VRGIGGGYPRRTYGAEQPLQAGMQLDADVILENRRLWEWMLEPLFTVTGKWTG